MILARRGGAYALRLLPVRAYGRLMPREVIGLCYHVVSDQPLPHITPLYPFKSVAQFDADLRWLKRRYRFVSLPELLHARETGRPLGPHAVYLSFDDAYGECFSVVRPLLLQHGLPCTFFITTEAVGNRQALAFNQVALCLSAMREMEPCGIRAILAEMEGYAGRPLPDADALSRWLRPALRNPDSPVHDVLPRLVELAGVDVDAFLRTRPYLTEAEVRQLASEGFAIGGHSRLHWHLGSVADPARVEEEIVESCRVAAALSGAERVAFAFPYDGIGVDRRLLEDIVRRHPFIGPVFGSGGLARESRLVLHRMLVDAPPAFGGGRSNLPGVFRGAYLDEVLRLARRGGVSGPGVDAG